MAKTRTVTLELLRHGPPHNQLLSPLTQYLALCGNHPPTTITVPFEHNQLLVRLRALRYQDTLTTRVYQLKDTAALMGEVLGRLPGLIAELAEEPGPESTLTHLRIILSATELALLPFEMASAPNGFPGEGQALTLQPQTPLCMTREVRRVSNTRYNWPSQPRILLLVGTGPLPVDEHLLMLRRLIEPWVVTDDASPDRPTNLDDYLMLLPQANAHEIQQTCAQHDYTHVHILAHGVPDPAAPDREFGLSFHPSPGATENDIVSGARMADMLRTQRRGSSNTLSGPAAVTIASCESGNVGSVVGAGASIAHALHEAGIPLVVAAQFPLSFEASLVMAEVLYEGFLWAQDPRLLLRDLRTQLRSRVKDTHDWASLVAYAAFPDNLQAQFARIRLEQSRRSIWAALRFIVRVLRRLKTKRSSTEGPSPTPSVPIGELRAAIGRARTKISDAANRLRELLRDTPRSEGPNRAGIYGLLASTAKYDAEILYRLSLDENKEYYREAPMKKARTVTDLLDRSVRELKESLYDYSNAFRADRDANWALVQELCLSAALNGPVAITFEAWTTAKVLSEADLTLPPPRNVWAHANLVELYLLSQLKTLPADVTPKTNAPADGFPWPNAAQATEKAIEHAEKLVAISERGSEEVESLRRNISRYIEWFSDISAVNGFLHLEAPVNAVLRKLPEWPWPGD
jgi:hypothetical protein